MVCDSDTHPFKSASEAWAWAAGIFSGEGCATHTFTRGKKYPRLAVCMTDRDEVEKFARVIGYGNVNYEYTPSQKSRGQAPTWRWSCAKRSEVERICNRLYPFLGERRQARMRELGVVDAT